LSEKEAKENLNTKAKKHLSQVITNLFAALIIWLFGVLVFIPAAKQILPQRIPLATSLIILIAFTIFIIKTINSGLEPLLNSTSNVIAFKYKSWKKPKTPIKNLQSTIKHMLYISATLLIYLLYSPFLITINPALNGLVLIPIILWIMWTTLKIINTLTLEK